VPDQVRYDRAIGRDGASYRKQWQNWAAQERSVLDEDQIYDAADLVLVAHEPDERHHTSALAIVQAMLASEDHAAGQESSAPSADLQRKPARLDCRAEVSRNTLSSQRLYRGRASQSLSIRCSHWA